MIAKYPELSRQKSCFQPVVLDADRPASWDEEEHAWIPWVFQRMRGECPTLFFEKPNSAQSRHEVLSAWKHFTENVWATQLAPAMLYALQHASQSPCDAVSTFLDVRLRYHFEPTQHQRSLRLGAKLLEVTEGAKYQGALGRLRERVEAGSSLPHLPVVWGCMANLFQLLPQDMLVAYLQEEWKAMARFEPSLSAMPMGPLSVRAVVSRSLRVYLKEQAWELKPNH